MCHTTMIISDSTRLNPKTTLISIIEFKRSQSGRNVLDAKGDTKEGDGGTSPA